VEQVIGGEVRRQRSGEDGFERNQRLGPDLFLQKQAGPDERGIADRIPCYFSKNSLLAGNLVDALGRGGFDAVRMGLAGRTEPRA
jgi:hypothetical protein